MKRTSVIKVLVWSSMWARFTFSTRSTFEYFQRFDLVVLKT